jgi:WD40 repeat protein
MMRTHTPRTLALLTALLLARPVHAGGQPAARTDALGDPLPEGALVRLGTVRLRHGEGVCAVVYSPDGRLLASTSRDHTLRIWEASTGRQLRQFHEPNCEYHALAFAPDGAVLAASAGDPLRGGNSAIRLFDAASGKEVLRLEGHQQAAYTLAFAPDGRSLLSVSCGQVIQWDLPSGRLRHEWKNLRSTSALAVAPDRHSLASVGERDDTSIHIWDAAKGKERSRLKGHERGVAALAYRPDGARLASANPFEPIRVWDVTTGKVAVRFEEPHGAMALAFSPDGAQLASASMSGTVRIWDAGTGRLIRSLRDYHGWVNGLAFSPDGKALALAGADCQTVHVWEVATGRDLRPLRGHQGDVNAVAFSPDGRTLASGGGDRQDGDTAIRMWDAHSGRELRVLEGHAGRVHCLAFSFDGRTLVSGGEREDEVRLWDVATGACVRRLRRAAPAADDNNSADRRVSALAFSADGRLLAAGLDEGAVAIWDVVSGEQRRGPVGHDGRVMSVAFSPDGRMLATGSLDRTARLWDVSTGKQLRSLGTHEDSIRSVAFSPDGRLVAGAGGDWEGVWLWEAATGREVGRIPCGQTRLYGVAFSPDGRTLAVGSAGHGLRLWEVATRKERRILFGHPGGVHSLAFTADGSRLATGSSDSTVLVWDVVAPDGALPEGLTLARLEQLWADLGGEDALRADRAIRTLLAAPEEAVPFLAGRLRPLPVLSAEEQAEVLRDLDHPRYQVRDRATNELARLGELAKPLLRKTLRAPTSPETRRRVQILLERLAQGRPSAENLRAVRAFEVLERIGTAEVRPLLEAHAREAPEAQLGQEARASLERLTRSRPADSGER